MDLRCQIELNWYEVGKETPREHLLLFLVIENDPETIYTGFFVGGEFRLAGQECAIPLSNGTKVTYFAYVNNSMLPTNCKEGCLGSGWRLTDCQVPGDDEPVAIWPEVHGHRFAVWNPYDDCWDTADGDDYLCDKFDVKKWYPVNWGGAC